MTELLHNIYCGPKRRIPIHYEPLDVYLEVDPEVLASLLGEKRENLPKAVENYAKAGLDITKRPRKFAQVVNRRPAFKKSKIETENSLKIESLRDRDVLIFLLCATVGDLYVPNKTLLFYESNFDDVLYFLKGEIYD